MPTVPAAAFELVITGATPAGAIVIVTVDGRLVPEGFVAVSVTTVTPGVEGVPVMAPVVGLMVSPVGKDPFVTDQAVEEGRLPDVRPAENRDERQRLAH